MLSILAMAGVALVSVLGCSTRGSPPRAPADAVTYSRDHDIRYVNPATREWSTPTVTDELTLWPGPDGELHFTVSLFHAQAHKCELSGTARSVGGALEYREGLDPPGEPAECILRIEFQASDVVLRDATGGCRRAHCGGRGHFDGVRLSIDRW